MPSKNERPTMHRRASAPVPSDVETFIESAGRPDPEPEKTTGRKPPEGTVRMNANIPESLHRKLKVRAAEEGLSVTDLVVSLISRYLSA